MVKITLKDTRDGFTKCIEVEDNEFSYYLWAKGSYSCDCNRSTFLYNWNESKKLECNTVENIIVIYSVEGFPVRGFKKEEWNDSMTNLKDGDFKHHYINNPLFHQAVNMGLPVENILLEVLKENHRLNDQYIDLVCNSTTIKPVPH